MESTTGERRGRAMIETIGFISGIGFLIWLTAALILYAVAKHWMDR